MSFTKRNVIIFLLMFLLILVSSVVLGHSEDATQEVRNVGKGFVWYEPINFIILSGLWLILVTFVLLCFGTQLTHHYKKILFIAITAPIAISTIYLAGYTIHENYISVSKGPVHFHADYQVWHCGERLDLVDPKFPSNKVGTPVFHEHDDDRMHIEGTIVTWDEATLGHYFEIIGGELQDGHLRFPLNGNDLDVENGDLCPSGRPGWLKVFVNGKRIDDYYSYLMYPDPLVPPGDCIIIQFDESDASTTSLLCESWEAFDWNYDNFERRPITIGDKEWQ